MPTDIFVKENNEIKPKNDALNVVASGHQQTYGWNVILN